MEKRRCLICGDEPEDTTWYSDSGVPTEEDVICEFCYMNLKPIEE